MPDSRQSRGPHPEDPKLFDKRQYEKLLEAVKDFSWLLSRGYPRNAGLELVGNRYRLKARQRLAVSRAGCSDEERSRRNQTKLEMENVKGKVCIDGFNLIVTWEAILSGGVILRCRDGCFRDLSSVHGSYRHVEQTITAVESIGNYLSQAGITEADWYLDKPVSNSGRLSQTIKEVAKHNTWSWRTKIVWDPDKELKKISLPGITSDSIVLNSGIYWLPLVERFISETNPAWILDFADCNRSD